MEILTIRTTSQTPIYQQIYEQISTQILNGTLESDSPLPSIRAMAKELRVSIITIKKTWELLESNNYIYTVAGKGSYIKKNSKSALEKKKLNIVKDSLKENITHIKQMNITEEKLLEMVSNLYKQS